MRNENTPCEGVPNENTPCVGFPNENKSEGVPNENTPHELIPHSSNKKTGAFGERLAAHHLETLGFILIARNLKVGRLGEIDLVARAEDGRTLCFVEVKTRTSERY